MKTELKIQIILGMSSASRSWISHCITLNVMVVGLTTIAFAMFLLCQCMLGYPTHMPSLIHILIWKKRI